MRDDFEQSYFVAERAILSHPMASGLKVVAVAILNTAGRGDCTASYETLSARCGLSRAQVIRSVKVLTQAGLFRVEGSTEAGTNRIVRGPVLEAMVRDRADGEHGAYVARRTVKLASGADATPLVAPMPPGESRRCDPPSSADATQPDPIPDQEKTTSSFAPPVENPCNVGYLTHRAAEVLINPPAEHQMFDLVEQHGAERVGLAIDIAAQQKVKARKDGRAEPGKFRYLEAILSNWSARSIEAMRAEAAPSKAATGPSRHSTPNVYPPQPKCDPGPPIPASESMAIFKSYAARADRSGG